ncbi:ECF transporter S component [Agromyces mediolanus]|uniref:ECF transporter S component n=1 Tax=Agromyces mediolanus TaxID=41986 RepID=UPI001E291F77|nr:ECF transporter S component [Agromyces mediolanus]MCD1569786.1 ECF transporter S component [Agromyces mediolanus]
MAPRTSTSTRILLSCAAIGVAGGVVAGGSGYLALVLAAIGPMFYGVTIGVHFLPSIVAFALLRRPGTALLAGLIAGLVGAAFAPQWLPRLIGTALLVGVLVELPFLLTRYRRWEPWLYYASGLTSGIVIAVVVYLALGGEHFPAWMWAIALPLYAGSPVLFTWIGRVIALQLERAGVARGLR